MDHFALPQDSLAIAQQQGELYRNFQGYSTHAQFDIVGLGLSLNLILPMSYYV